MSWHAARLSGTIIDIADTTRAHNIVAAFAVTLADSVDSGAGGINYTWPPFAVPGRYWVAVVKSSAPGRIIGGSLANTFEIVRPTCTSHSECSTDTFCENSGICYPCSACISNLDSIDGWCPQRCGGGVSLLEEGQSWPVDTLEVDAAGVAEASAATGWCIRESLVYAQDTRVHFNPVSLTNGNWSSRLMSVRLHSAVNTLGALVSNHSELFDSRQGQAKLSVLRTYTEMAIDTGGARSLHHEGRAADIAVVGANFRGGYLAELAKEAGFDYVSFEDPEHLHVSVIPDTCQTSLDLIFLLDGSGSVELEWYGGMPGNFQTRILGFVQEVVSFFHVSADATRVGVATFSSTAVVNFHLNEHYDNSSLVAAINDIDYPTGGTRTSEGLRMVRESMFQEDHGMRPAREGVSRVLIVLTDGQANNGYEPSGEAALLRDQGVSVFAIGVGNDVDDRELQGMASTPYSSHVHRIRSFRNVRDIVDTMSSVTCDEAATISFMEETVATIGSCEKRYYRPTCASPSTNALVSETIVVRLQVTSGSAGLYISRNSTRPGPSIYDVQDVSSNSIKVVRISRIAGHDIHIGVYNLLGLHATFHLKVYRDLFPQADTIEASVVADSFAGTPVFALPNSLGLDLTQFEVMVSTNTAGSALLAAEPAAGVVVLASRPWTWTADTISGEVRIYERSTPCLTGLFDFTVTVLTSGEERGVLGLVLSPTFSADGYVYVYWSPAARERYRLSRFAHVENGGGLSSVGDISTELVLWEDTDGYSSCCHYGGGLEFGIDGYLYLATGDKFGGAETSQNVSRGGGKLHRLNPDGSMPAENMGFDDGPGGAMLDSVYAIGLRNPYQMTLDRPTGRLLIADVGGNYQRTAWEEVNLAAPRKNYGWPMCEGPCGSTAAAVDFPECDCSIHESPVYAYPHRDDYIRDGLHGRGASIVGGIVYRVGRGATNPWPAAFHGMYLFGEYAFRKIYMTPLSSAADHMPPVPSLPMTAPYRGPGILPHLPLAFIAQQQDGTVWYGNTLGQIRRIRYAVDNRPPVASLSASTTLGPPPLVVDFTVDVYDPDDHPISHNWIVSHDRADGQLLPDVSLPATPAVTHTFSQGGVYTVSYTAFDGFESTTEEIVVYVGTPPEATIAYPAHHSTFVAEDILTFEASVVPGINYLWTFRLKHNDHYHPVFEDYPGPTASAVVESSGHVVNEEITYVLTLSAENSLGIVNQTEIELLPRLSRITIEASHPGLMVQVDGLPFTTPVSFQSLIGFHHEFFASPSQVQGGSRYIFQEWHDAQSTQSATHLQHSVMVPQTEATYRMLYVLSETHRLFGVNCGGPALIDDPSNRWMSDGDFISSGRAVSTGVAIANPVFTTERYSRSRNRMTLVFPMSVTGTIELVFYFLESYWTNAGRRVFSIYINDEMVEGGVDVFERVGWRNPLTITHQVFSTGTELTVTLSKGNAGNDFPILNGIELYSIRAAPTAPPITTAPIMSPTTLTPTQTPTTLAPTTATPTTHTPTTPAPTTIMPTTQVPTTLVPTTATPTTENPTTSTPTTVMPTTQAPTTLVPTTATPTTETPITMMPTTQAPLTVAPTTQMPTSEIFLSNPHSASLCSELGWPFKYSNRDVCAASSINGVCHKNSATFEEANSICSSVGARLCTLTEIEADAARGTGCSIDSHNTWTSTPCDSQRMYVRTGRYLPNRPPICASRDGASVHSVRCCADKSIAAGQQGPTPVQSERSNSVDLHSHPIVTTNNIHSHSASLCSELGWPFKYSNRDVCAASSINGVCHKNSATFEEANSICSSVGARLCTLTEIEADAARGTGCSIDSHNTWTSTLCSNGLGVFVRTGRYIADRAASCVLRGSTTTHSVRCCGDRVAEVSTTNAVEGATHSASLCSELGWPFKYSNRDVCAASSINGVCHKNSATFEEANSICSSVGARLCTLTEIEADAARGTGCSIDSHNTWTSTLCSNGLGVFVRTGRYIADRAASCVLRGSTTTHSVRCCADRRTTQANSHVSRSSLNQAKDRATPIIFGLMAAICFVLGLAVYNMCRDKTGTYRLQSTRESDDTSSVSIESMTAPPKPSKLVPQRSSSRLRQRASTLGV